jgi:ATP-dependent helicase HrpA
LHRESPFGDILIFMPTEQDIRETLDLLEGRSLQGTSILPLYARLGASEQSKVFSRTSGRKIIVATNVAETSITIPGIKYVIDTGLARISRYTPSSRTTSLPVVAISKSSADQRKGRCGRVENGICIRLYPEKDYEDRPLFTPPEILRANLADVILKMTALKLGDISDFPFIDRPALKSIKDGFTLLSELGAMIPASDRKKSKGSRHATGKAQPGFSLTEKGRVMAKIPLDPRLSRMLIEAQEQGCIKETAVIASALSIQDPRERPAEKALEADRIHNIFKDPSSDFITLLNLWNTFHDNGSDNKKRTTGDMKRFCKKHYLSFKRMKEWRDIHAQICDVLKESGISNKKQQANGPIPDLKPGEFSPLYASIHKSILSGFLSNIAVKKEKNIFKAAKGKEVMIFPGSALFNRAGTWIVAAEMVETSRLFARTTATIDNRWLEDLGKLQCKYTYMDPHWEKNRGEVVASEQVSLYGLLIIPKRSVSYGRIDPDHASEFFIRSALVEGDVKHPFSFMKHNQKLIDDIIKMEDKIRRRDILVSDEDMFEFYRQKLDSIYDIRTLRKLLKDKGKDRFLRMGPKDLIRYFPDKEELSLFPDEINQGNTRFEYTYNFEPGKKN